MDKPHLVLHWTFDVPNNILSCEISEDLKYLAYEGGTLPFTKIHKCRDGLWPAPLHPELQQWYIYPTARDEF
jgi:hypothetical protein